MLYSVRGKLIHMEPRTAVIECAGVGYKCFITMHTARQGLDRMEVDELGLDMVDRRMLEAMIKHYNGGPVGLDTLAAVIGEEAVTIEDVYEPYLMQIGFIQRTPRGRVVLPAAYAHLGIEYMGQMTLG